MKECDFMGIEIKKLTKSYSGKTVLENFSCSIAENSVSCIRGISGRGKTTLLNILMGLEKADSGEIKGTKGKRFAVVFQEDRLCENLSAFSNVKMVCNDNVGRKDIITALEELGLAGSVFQKAAELSGGMRQRVAIARALMSDYDILILDEPYTALDEEIKDITIAWVLEKSRGKTVLMVSHDHRDCEKMSASAIDL